jgi:peptidoglycan/LPS O-acetylase OafA/YrhL
VSETASDGAPTPFGYHPELDGIRAIAIGAVLAYHASNLFFPGGYLGVDLFFVLSGYLITSLLVRERDVTGRIDLGKFYMRRALRILPPLGLGLAFAALFPVNGTFAPWSLGALAEVATPVLLFFANFVDPDQLDVMHHTWSLSVEEQFYLVWPVVFALLRFSPKPLLIALAALVVAGPVLRIGLLEAGVELEWVYRAIRPGGLALGCIAALIAWRPPGWLAAMSLGAICVALVLAPRDWMIGVGLTLFSLLAAVTIKGVATAPRGFWLKRLLAHPVLVWAGRRSYGAYVYHFPIVAALLLYKERQGLPLAALMAVLVLATFAVAELSYRFVEAPIMKLKRRFQPAPGPAARTAAPAATSSSV